MTEQSTKLQDQHPIELLILAFLFVAAAIIDLWQALHLVYSRELALQRREARTNVLVPVVEQAAPVEEIAAAPPSAKVKPTSRAAKGFNTSVKP
jgi:hypothetical protein